MNTLTKYGTVVALALAVAPYSNAGLIQGELFNTGLDRGGNLITGTDPDVHWNTVVPQGEAVAYYNGAYAANDLDSQWISVATDGGSNQAEFRETVFSTTFDLTGYVASTALITGLWGVDNSATVFLNGSDTSVALPYGTNSFSRLSEFSISDFFVSGINTLTVNLTNGYPDLTENSIGPLALRFDNLELSATKVPEPETLALLGLGLVALGVSRRRKA